MTNMSTTNAEVKGITMMNTALHIIEKKDDTAEAKCWKEFCSYRWSWCSAFLFLGGTGAPGTLGTARISPIPPHLLAHCWQPVCGSGRTVLLVGLSQWGLHVVLIVTVHLCSVMMLVLSMAGDASQGAASLGHRVKLFNTVTLLCTLTASQCTVTSLQPAFGPSLWGRGAAHWALWTRV